MRNFDKNEKERQEEINEFITKMKPSSPSAERSLQSRRLQWAGP
jgi:hypothetical protein